MNLKWRLCVSCFTVIICALYLLARNSLKGGSVEGWEGNVSRNAGDYINDNLWPLIMPKNFCTEEKTLLVVVCSKPEGFEARQAIRETWGQKYAGATFVFLLGEVGTNFLLQHKIDVESNRYKDIIQERFIDTYNNLTLKSVHMLKLFNLYCSKTYRFLMKVDDDVYINISPLVRKLAKKSQNSKFLVGRVRYSTKPYRNSGNKWYMPYEWYPNDTYPQFLCGPAYVMSASAAKDLYKCVLTEPLLHLEDVYLTGICPQKMGIDVNNSNYFTCNRMKGGICKNFYLYTNHYLTPSEVREAYDILTNNLCREYKEINVLEWWMFFLNIPSKLWPD